MRCRLNSTGNFGRQLKRLMQSINEDIALTLGTHAGFQKRGFMRLEKAVKKCVLYYG
ncbi:hypothetical protein MELB17_10523 [Marinobacter sp. ELB17]|nr:hypothetical protein MELB17_10523 [Marinobacter sp. ELB17]